ncbi:MAG: hypothetical protein HFJ06_08755 [Lachnospiraceae bacterium]|nr:hypothetical protein [Lachnospiraceae bacterium]
MKKGFIAVLGSLAGAAAGAAAVKKFSQQKVEVKDKKVDKFKSYYNMLNQWLTIRQEGGSLSEYFDKNDFVKIAVYGLGEMGSRLIDELKGTKTEIVYGIDKNIENAFSGVQVYSLENVPMDEKVDVVVVTAVFAFDEIKEQLENVFDCDIISLRDVIFEC